MSLQSAFQVIQNQFALIIEGFDAFCPEIFFLPKRLEKYFRDNGWIYEERFFVLMDQLLRNTFARKVHRSATIINVMDTVGELSRVYPEIFGWEIIHGCLFDWAIRMNLRIFKDRGGVRTKEGPIVVGSRRQDPYRRKFLFWILSGHHRGRRGFLRQQNTKVVTVSIEGLGVTKLPSQTLVEYTCQRKL